MIIEVKYEELMTIENDGVLIHLTLDEARDLLNYLEMAKRRLIAPFSHGVIELVNQMKSELGETP